MAPEEFGASLVEGERGLPPTPLALLPNAVADDDVDDDDDDVVVVVDFPPELACVSLWLW